MTDQEKAKKYDEIVDVIKSLEQDALDEGMEEVDLELFALGEAIYYEIYKV